MIYEYMFSGLLVFAALTTLLTAGLLFTFALLVMPGLSRLEDRAFLLAFQQMDGIIQRGHPVFLVVWLGSLAALVAVAFMGGSQLEAGAHWILIAAASLYFLGVQVPTITGNVPLNNRLKTVDLAALDNADLAVVRRSFEGPWNRLNRFRTVVAILVSLLLLQVMRMS